MNFIVKKSNRVVFRGEREGRGSKEEETSGSSSHDFSNFVLVAMRVSF